MDTLRIQKSKGSKEFYEVVLRDIDEDTFLVVQKLLAADNEIAACRAIIVNCWVSGEPKETFLDKKNFQLVRAARGPLLEILQPLEAELKKN